MSRKKWPPSAEKKVHVNKEAHTCQEKSDHSVARTNWWLMSADYWLIIDHWWLMINNWWLMTDDWWLMIDDWYNMKWTPYCLPQGGTPPEVIYILHFILYLYLFYHQSSIITHHSSIISHQSSVINHQLSIINHPWSMINHQSSITSYQSSIIHDQWSIISHQLPVIYLFMKKNKLPWRNGSGIGFMRCWLVGPKQKNEIFHCYNGLGGSSRGVDGVYGEKTWPFWWSWGSSGNLEKSKLPGEVLEPKLWLYEPHRGRNRC